MMSKNRSTAAPEMSLPARKTGRQLNDAIVQCERCPRLIAHCKDVGAKKRLAYRDENYWARPVPNFGTLPTALLIVGLAPAAHGANRTGRMFTGDQSGLWLYRALHRAGLATKMHSENRHDELRLVNCAISSVCHCAPPKNKPSNVEITNCQLWLWETLAIAQPKVILGLGQLAWNSVCRYAIAQKWVSGSRPAFGHGRSYRLTEQIVLLGCYHPSQQNTFTGRLTEAMLDEIMDRAKSLAGLPPVAKDR